MTRALLIDRAVIAGVTYSGQAPEQLQEWRVVANASMLELNTAPTCLVLEPAGLAISNGVNPALPEAPERPKPANRVFLPLGRYGNGHPVSALFELAGSQGEGQLFTPDQIEAAKEGLRAFAREHQSPLSLGKLSRELPSAAFDVTGHREMGYYLCPPASIDAAFKPGLHYGRYSLDEIQQIYLQVTAELDRRFDQVATRPTFTPAPLDASWVGSVFSPHAETVAQIVARLKEQIPAIGRGRLKKTVVAQVHNALTNYVITMFMAASGIRPFTQGLAALAPLAGHWLVDEKPQEGPMARWIPVPPSAARQWQYYMRHCEVVRREFGFADTPELFYVHNRAGTFQEVTPKLWSEVMQGEADNGLRHWLPNELRRRGWYGDRVRLLMGHHPRGWEPGDPWSAIEVQWTPEEIASIEDALAEVGFVPMQGYGRG